MLRLERLRTGRAVADGRGYSRQGRLYGPRPRRHGAPELCGRYRPVPARPLLDDVRDAPVDDPPVCGFLDRRGVQRILPPQPGRRAEGSVGGIRPCYAPRLRRRPPARGGRRGQSRRVDLLGRGHEGTVQRHSARQDVGVDDHERCRAAHPGILHRDGSGAGLHARPAGRYDPERHPQGVHGAQHLYISARVLDADHRRHLRVHLEEHAQVQLDLDLGVPHAGGRRHGRHRAGLHAGRRTGVPARRYQRRHVGGRLRPPPVVLLGNRHEPLHGDRQDARGTYAVGQDRQAVRAQEPQVAGAAHPLADLGLVAYGAGSVQQRGTYRHRGHGRRPGTHPVAAHQRFGRGHRPADRLLGTYRP